jgi:hypothetical protein
MHIVLCSKILLGFVDLDLDLKSNEVILLSRI